MIRVKRFLIMCLICCICLTEGNITIFASEMVMQTAASTKSTINTSGTLGDNGGFQWNYNPNTATLTITGSDTGLNGDKTKESPLKSIGIDTIEKVVFDKCEFKGSLSFLLDFCSSVKKVEFNKCDTSKVTDMSRMFFFCSNLTSLNLKGFDTSQVTNMSAMFAGCDALTKLDLSSFNTSKVTDMSCMFSCWKLKTLKISNFNTSQVTNMSAMFGSCVSLTSLDLRKWYIKNGTNTSSMFYDCNSLKSLYTPKKIGTKVSIKLPAKFLDGNRKKYTKVTSKMKNKFLFTKCSYTIKFVGNGATSGSMKSMTKRAYGTSYTLTANKYKRKGYVFKGWNTKANGRGTAYTNKTKVKNLTKTDGKTVKLYAQWKKKKYKITYVLNNGKNHKKNPASYYVTTSTIKLKNPTRSGYVFQGWYSDSAYKKKVTTIKKGSTGNKTLYAKWKKKK